MWFRQKKVKNVKISRKFALLRPPGGVWGVRWNFFWIIMLYFIQMQLICDKTFLFWPIFNPLKPKMTINSQNSLKYPPWGVRGGPIKKIFFQKVITHQDATFLGQKFFSKTNILGSRFFSDPLGLKIRKIAKTGHYGQLFFWGIFFFSTPSTYWSWKTMGNKVQGGCIWPPCICPTNIRGTGIKFWVYCTHYVVFNLKTDK